MASLMEDLLTFFTSVDANIKVGKNAWYDTMLDKPDLAIAVYEVPGQPIISQIAGASRKVSIVVRDLKATVALPLCNKLCNSLITESGIINLTPQRWTTVSIQYTPCKLKVDENNRVYYSFVAIFTTYTD